MATPKILLTEDQRMEITQIPSNINEYEIAKYYTFSAYDISIINKHRREYNRLGFAVQLAQLRNPGCSLSFITKIPKNVLNYIAEQIQGNPKEFELYAKRENTKLEHLEEIKKIYEFRNYNEKDHQSLIQILLPHAMENDNIVGLIKLAIQMIRKGRIIIPGVTTIEKAISEVIATANNKIIEILNKNLTDIQKIRLDELISTQNEELNTKLDWLKKILVIHLQKHL